jgi:predicted nucleic-acid-binding protein
VRITADTNVLVRAIIQDDAKQGKIAAQILREADHIAIPLTVLCEFVWVLRRLYDISKSDIAAAITTLANSRNVVLNRPAVDAGLAVLQSGGDFADGIIAFEGQALGGDVFVSFDKKAVAVLKRQGQSVDLLPSR